MNYFDYRGQCNIASYMIQNMLEEETVFRNQDDVDSAFSLISSLLKDQEKQSSDSHETEEFADEQNLVARLLHLIRADDVDSQFLVKNRFSTSSKILYFFSFSTVPVKLWVKVAAIVSDTRFLL